MATQNPMEFIESSHLFRNHHDMVWSKLLSPGMVPFGYMLYTPSEHALGLVTTEVIPTSKIPEHLVNQYAKIHCDVVLAKYTAQDITTDCDIASAQPATKKRKNSSSNSGRQTGNKKIAKTQDNCRGSITNLKLIMMLPDKITTDLFKISGVQLAQLKTEIGMTSNKEADIITHIRSNAIQSNRKVKLFDSQTGIVEDNVREIYCTIAKLLDSSSNEDFNILEYLKGFQEALLKLKADAKSFYDEFINKIEN